jgi:ABC-2 type transport system ATP-binding protein
MGYHLPQIENAMSHSPMIIETHELTKRFGGVVAVDKVSLEIGEQEIFGLIGPNGAGKSTLIKMLTTLLPATSGSALVAGFDVRRQPAQVRARIGYVPQLLSADGSLTAYENLLLSARLYLIPRSERRSRIDEALQMMDLTDASHRLVQEFSGGMIRRLEIAQAMLHHPPLLFMDEPTVGLDPLARRTVWEHVRRLQTRFGTTILITTHLMEEADELCGRIGVLHNGRLEKVGTPAELKAGAGPDASLDDVFTQITGAELHPGEYRNVRQTRRSLRSLS